MIVSEKNLVKAPVLTIARVQNGLLLHIFFLKVSKPVERPETLEGRKVSDNQSVNTRKMLQAVV